MAPGSVTSSGVCTVPWRSGLETADGNPVELYQLGINDLAAGIEPGVSPSEVVQALLARIEAVGDEIDAFAVVTADTAIRQATQAESALAREDERPLLGSDELSGSADTAGIATEAGSALFAGRVPFEDAPVWSALVKRDACSSERPAPMSSPSALPRRPRPTRGIRRTSPAARREGAPPLVAGLTRRRWDRHRRVDQDPVRPLRHGWVEADRHPRPGNRSRTALVESRQRRPNGALPLATAPCCSMRSHPEHPGPRLHGAATLRVGE